MKLIAMMIRDVIRGAEEAEMRKDAVALEILDGNKVHRLHAMMIRKGAKETRRGATADLRLVQIK
jgi:phosphate uptake regulator